MEESIVNAITTIKLILTLQRACLNNFKYIVPPRCWLAKSEKKNLLEATSVVIIHRPGCEEVELLVVDFAGLLKSYGIDVRMTLLEQTMVDAVGGIAYYMQKNIQQCDFVLILLTEPAGKTFTQNTSTLTGIFNLDSGKTFGTFHIHSTGHTQTITSIMNIN